MEKGNESSVWRPRRTYPSSSSNYAPLKTSLTESRFQSKNSKNVEVSNMKSPAIHKNKSETKKDFSDRPSSVMGTCPDMCPAKERFERERCRDLSIFERLHGNPCRTSPELAVKKFCRTISTMHSQASDIRPLPVLKNTLTYLCSLMDSSEHPFDVVHDFIFDRTRSIRQDVCIQGIVGDQAIQLYEKMVTFHIISHHKLPRCQTNSNISSLCYLNREQLLKTLVSLYDLYEYNHLQNMINKNEAEFYSFYVLLHLGFQGQSTGELSLWFRKLPSSILKSKEINFVRSILRYFRLGNYRRFFAIIEAEASYLQLCIIEPLFNEVRMQALLCINHGGYKLHPFPLAHLSELLMMKEEEVEAFCNACGLATITDSAGNKYLPAKQTFPPTEGLLRNYSFSGSKRMQRLVSS